MGGVVGGGYGGVGGVEGGLSEPSGRKLPIVTLCPSSLCHSVSQCDTVCHSASQCDTVFKWKY